MDAASAIDLTRQTILLIVLLAAPVLGVGLVVGFVVSLAQAVTQLQDQTLSFVPKIIAMLLGLAIFGPWMIAKIVEFGRDMFSTLP